MVLHKRNKHNRLSPKEKDTNTMSEALLQEPQSAPVKYCLSGNGKVVLGRKSNFSMGGDATLKSKLIKERLNGVIDETIPDAAREYAAQAWPKLVQELADGTHDKLQRAARKEQRAQEAALVKEQEKEARKQEKAAKKAAAAAAMEASVDALEAPATEVIDEVPTV